MGRQVRIIAVRQEKVDIALLAEAVLELIRAKEGAAGAAKKTTKRSRSLEVDDGAA